MTWNSKKVVVTGAGGFIGSHLVERLIGLGADVTAFVRYNSRNDASLLEFIGEQKKQIRIVYGDLRELETIQNLLRDQEVVFHLAALVGIPYSYRHPNEVVDVNTIGTLNVLTAARDHGLANVVVASTSEVYGSAQYVPIDENHPKQPQSPYSASKIAADAIALSFHNAFALPVTVVRPFNTYGPRQSDRAIIPTLICQALTRDEIVVGNLSPTRDFTYVTDTVDGFIRAAESKEALGHEMNLGTGSEVSIGELAEEILAMVGRQLNVRQTDERKRPSASEVNRLLSNNERAKRLTGWEPRVSLRDGLAMTIEFVKGHPNLYAPESYRI
jgi:dTDP-glucose 4,6-dehydratase